MSESVLSEISIYNEENINFYDAGMRAISVLASHETIRAIIRHDTPDFIIALYDHSYSSKLLIERNKPNSCLIVCDREMLEDVCKWLKKFNLEVASVA